MVNRWGSIYFVVLDRVCDVPLTEPSVRVNGYDVVLLVVKQRRREGCFVVK